MKRAASEYTTDCKRYRTSRSLPIPDIGHGCLGQQASLTPRKSSLAIAPQAETQWSQRAQSIATWVRNTESPPPSSRLPVNNDNPVLDTMSLQSPRSLRDAKAKARRPRSLSPTKGSGQYRKGPLKDARIRVDVIHDVPANVEAHLPRHLRDGAPATGDVIPDEGNDDISAELGAIANNYLEECRELAKTSASETAYRGILHELVIKPLARHPPWRRTLINDFSDKLWNAYLKPPLPHPVIIPQTWIPFQQNHILQKPTRDTFLVDSIQSSSDSNIESVRPYDKAFDFASSSFSREPSESSTSSHLDSMLSTPKPDITVGISPDGFRSQHERVLKAWQANNIVLSDPHAQLGDIRFPFLIIETKGQATDSSMIGAQNQAAGGGTCALRALESLETQMPEGTAVPRIVFSVTTEGAVHELWVHYRIIEGEDAYYHMTCLRIWRTTFRQSAHDFVATIASIFRWGVDVYFQQIEHALDVAVRGGS